MPKMSKTFPGLTEKGRKAHIKQQAKRDVGELAYKTKVTAMGARTAALAATMSGDNADRAKRHGKHALQEGRKARVYSAMATAKALHETKKEKTADRIIAAGRVGSAANKKK